MSILRHAFLTGMLFCSCFSASGPAKAAQPELVIYTENYKPFYHLDEKGRISGTVTNLVRQLAEDAGISIELRLWPFRRGLLNVQKSAGSCFMALWRTPAREPDFTWVGPLQVDGFAFFALRGSNVSLSSMEDSFKFPTGAVGGWTSTLEVQHAGHPGLVLVDDDDLNLKMLATGNIRLWLGGLLSAPYVAEQEGVGIENVYTIREIDLSLACNPATDKSVTGRLQAALDMRSSRMAGTTPSQNPKRLTQ